MTRLEVQYSGKLTQKMKIVRPLLMGRSPTTRTLGALKQLRRPMMLQHHQGLNHLASHSRSSGLPQTDYPSTEPEAWEIHGTPTGKLKLRVMERSLRQALADAWSRCFKDRFLHPQLRRKRLPCQGEPPKQLQPTEKQKKKFFPRGPAGQAQSLTWSQNEFIEISAQYVWPKSPNSVWISAFRRLWHSIKANEGERMNLFSIKFCHCRGRLLAGAY